MSRERTDADEFSIAMFGAIVVALVLTFVIGGLVTHWETKEASANLKGDPSRVSAVIESARVSYWSKDRLEGLKVQFDGEVYTPKITPVARNYSVVHRGHGNSGAGVYRKSDGKLGVGFVSGTGYGWYIGSPVSCSYSFNGNVESASPIQSGSVKCDGNTLNWYVYPMTVPVDSQKAGSVLSCGFLFDNLSANCSVNLSSPATNGGNKYVLNAMASFNNGASESLGIAGGTVRFSGLQYGKSYTFGDKSLEVAEDGTAEVEFTVPDYGYVDSKFPDLYSIRLVRAEGSSLETELILYVKRPIKIKSVVDARAGK